MRGDNDRSILIEIYGFRVETLDGQMLERFDFVRQREALSVTLA